MSNSSKGGSQTAAPQLCHPSARASNSSAAVADGASLVTSWLGAASGPPSGGRPAERPRGLSSESTGGPVLAAPHRGTAPCSSALGEACWAALALPGGKRGETRVPHLGTKEGPGEGQGGRGRPPSPSSVAWASPWMHPTHPGLVRPGGGWRGAMSESSPQLQEGQATPLRGSSGFWRSGYLQGLSWRAWRCHLGGWRRWLQGQQNPG